MPAHIVGTPGDITAAIDGFSGTYHADFTRVRALGRTYVGAAHPGAATAMLAPALRDVLASWGAGNREAPRLQSIAAFNTTLVEPTLHADLVVLHRSPLSSLTIASNHPIFVGKSTPSATLAAFDSNLFRGLGALATGLFHGNTNATYPMKVVLLITGLMPAFDSQVRCGLQRGGFIGMNKTQYLLPTNTLRADGKKIAGNLDRVLRQEGAKPSG